MTNPILEAARKYKEAGLHPIPLDPNTKKPSLPNWLEPIQNWQDFERVFTANRNIGIVLGKASGGLIDVDLDCDEAIKLADCLLPKTDIIFGRQSAPKSHRIYRCLDCKESRLAFSSPDQGVIVELRADKHQTVFPPSIHESGEQVAFEQQGEPATILFWELKRACELLAVGSILLPYWKESYRHSLSLALAGVFALSGWTQSDVEQLIRAVATAAGDADLEDRLSAVVTTYQKVQLKEPLSGRSELRRIVGDAVTERVCSWVGLPQVQQLDKQLPDVSSDAGAAMAFAERFRKDLIYVPEENHWYARNKSVYRFATPDQIQGAALNFMMDACNNLAGQYQFQQAKQLLSRGRINAIPELSRSKLSVSLETLDADPYLVGCKDGSVLDLQTRKLLDPGLAIVTKTIGTNYDPDAQCPTWIKFLDEIFPDDPETIKFLQRALGYTLTGRVDEQCLFVLVGTGANGKSTFIELAQALLDQYAATTPMQTLMVSRSEQSNDLAGLVGMRLVSASEGETGQRLAESKIKLMVGGDRIKCRRLYQDYIEMKPEFKLWILTNNLPTISGTDEAIWRRIRVVRFPVTIPADKRDGRLPDKLADELPGILNWMLDGLQSWLEIGLRPPTNVSAETNDYRSDNDTVGQFIDACCERDKAVKTTTKDLYNGYANWCEMSGYDPINKVMFGKTLGLKSLVSFKSGKGNGWRGLALKSEVTQP
jgi:putative DNA primase/helicase